MEGSCRSGAAITVCVRSQGTAAARTAGSAGVRSAAVITDQEENLMKIAVTYDNGEIFQHFGKTESFKVYEVEDNKVVSSQNSRISNKERRITSAPYFCGKQLHWY